MKKFSYCGGEYSDDFKVCPLDQRDLLYSAAKSGTGSHNTQALGTLSPTTRRLAIPLLLIVLSVLALLDTDISFLLRNMFFGVLAMPYIWIVGHPPFAYRDKPWFISPMGALATGLFWAGVSYLIIWRYSIFRRRRALRP